MVCGVHWDDVFGEFFAAFAGDAGYFGSFREESCLRGEVARFPEGWRVFPPDGADGKRFAFRGEDEAAASGGFTFLFGHGGSRRAEGVIVPRRLMIFVDSR